jgi:hypothetical protein
MADGTHAALDELADAFIKLGTKQKGRILEDCPDLYFALSKVVRTEEVRREMRMKR